MQMILLTIGWVAMLGFAIGYPVLAKPWWRSQFGRSLEASEISMVLLVGLSLTSYWFNYILPDWATTGLIVIIGIAAWLRLVAMLTEQLRRNPQPRVVILGEEPAPHEHSRQCPECGCDRSGGLQGSAEK